jgi:pimeloyl-ACP methyl ester carboxylesterase
MSAVRKPSIVFVHGLWADGSCFDKVAAPLQAEGYEVASSQHSLDTVAGDVAMVTRTLGRVSGPVLLVGHSYGGTVITHAGIDDRVAGLVYICALAPSEEETSQSLQERFPVTDVFAHVEEGDGRLWLGQAGILNFAGDLSEADQKIVWATQMSAAASLFTEQVEGIAWRGKPSHYIVGANDQTVHPDLQRSVADRMGATTHELQTSHVPMLSDPTAVLDVVRTAAEEIAG